ncbi:hypothetical protein AKJ41_01950 [candidate division MSBL1 archaeon SCGC-AAA259O05]|uniref:Carotenoid biosynthesis protein n=1 Tax=candidate division MSBL1 archaeon SCGC-AAA259O05 TaxID=1698271 RepID=A0A133V4C1_9EURY|nr:hypothetical protein AKJ41_01950 [candidate division MSBL1 archaeon SCGC-AAA259O05]
MVDPVYPIFTSAMFLSSFLCLKHATGNTDDLAFYLTSIVYGLILEKMTILAFHKYSYPAENYLVTFFGIPLAIGLGWSAVIYSCFTIGKELGFSEKSLPFFTGLFVLHIDLSMDAIAIRVSFWQWSPPGAWFGVQLGNFFGWYSVALLFSGSFLFLRKRIENRVFLGISTIFASVAMLIPLLKIWLVTTESLLSKVIFLFIVLGISFIILTREKTKLKEPALERIVPLLIFHLFFLTVLLSYGFNQEKPLLLPLSLGMLLIGILIHSLPRISSKVQVLKSS